MLLKYRDLFVLLVQRDIKLKYRRSFLGYVWSILNPLLSMLVMVIVFGHMFDRGIDNFPVYLICGNILFIFLRESSDSCINSIIANAALLKKIYVPKYIFSVSKVTSSLVNLVFSLGALIIVMVCTRAAFRLSAFLIVIPILELYVFCVGLGLFLASSNVFFRDIGNIWSVFTMAWMYATPIFYDLGSLSPALQIWVPRLNPMYVYITQMRDFIMYGGWPWTLIWQGALTSLIALLIGLFVFAKTKDRFILYI